MLPSDLVGFGLFLGYFILTGLPAILLRAIHRTPFEVTRKLYHLVITLSIFPLLKLFSAWYVAVLATFAFVLLVYPILVLVESSAFYQQIAVERNGGEFKSSLITVQLSYAILISLFWGLLGESGKVIIVAAVMAWGFGDAAAALVGKTFGRRKIRHPQIDGAKTVEGTLAMLAVAGTAIFFTLMVYAGWPWSTSVAAALFVAPICSAVELFTPRGMDTLTVPLSAAFAILPLVSLFSLLGA